ncbi:MAG TPA: two-component regulator propeller domain-containing protein [Chryseosolibacter sp.]|nr:two-component regulator propeller domain-containing protein [Chryseosolibacter sp.]
MKYPILVYATTLFLAIAFRCFGQQNIPIGAWRYHVSFSDVHSIAISPTQIFAATTNGIVVFDKEDNSLSTITKLSGLSGSGITSIGFDNTKNLLIVAYEDSNIDIVHLNEINNFSRLKELATITGSRRINHISVHHNYAYLSADYGVIVFDLTALDLKETWRDLGDGGTPLRIYKSEIFGDSIALATEKGVLIGNLSDNLLDYAKWKRFDEGTFNTSIGSVEYFNNALFAGISNDGLYKKSGTSFVKQPALDNAIFKSIETNEQSLHITANDRVYKMDVNGSLEIVDHELITKPTFFVSDADNTMWIGDAVNGLISDASGSFSSYLPNGPSFNAEFRLRFVDNRLYALTGRGEDASANWSDSTVNVWRNGSWTNFITTFNDIVDAEFFNNEVFLASWKEGIGVFNTAHEFVRQYNEDNSPLTSENNELIVSALYNGYNGMWIANYFGTNVLHNLSGNETWTSFSPDAFVATFPLDILEDPFGVVWMLIDPTRGGGIVSFDPFTPETKWFTETIGGGALPDIRARSIAIDRDGYVWVGTEKGVCYFFSDDADAVKPVFENRFLLRDETIHCIAVDGGNRKWMGTENGAWLFNPPGDELIHHFNVDNSPLMSDTIIDIAIDHTSGEVFFSTTKGIVSFRSDGTPGIENPDGVKIFPNPVQGNFAGTVGISGLYSDATVKITDVSGKLVWQSRAEGGTASWNGRDYNGNRPATGVYLVYAVNTDGTQSIVGKIAFIN